MDGGGVCLCRRAYLHRGADVLAPCGISHRHQSAPCHDEAHCHASAWGNRAVRQRQAAPHDFGNDRRNGNLSCPPAPRQGKGCGDHRGTPDASSGIRLAAGASEPCAGGSCLCRDDKHDRQGDAGEDDTVSERACGYVGGSGGIRAGDSRRQDLRSDGVFLQKVQRRHRQL